MFHCKCWVFSSYLWMIYVEKIRSPKLSHPSPPICFGFCLIWKIDSLILPTINHLSNFDEITAQLPEFSVSWLILVRFCVTTMNLNKAVPMPDPWAVSEGQSLPSGGLIRKASGSTAHTQSWCGDYIQSVFVKNLFEGCRKGEVREYFNV